MNRAFSRILILIILVILVGGGISAWQYLKKESEIEKQKVLQDPILICQKIKNEDIKNECLAIVKEDISFCDKGGERKDSCFYELAVQKEDPALCEKAGELKYRCYEDVAAITQDIQLCGKIPLLTPEIGSRNFCIQKVAIWGEEPYFCQKIETSEFPSFSEIKFVEELKEFCTIVSNEDFSSCQNLRKYHPADDSLSRLGQLYYVQGCQYVVAFRKNDPLLCEKITTDIEFREIEAATKNECYYHLAIKNRDSSLCKKISGSKEYYKECEAYSRGDILYCDEIEEFIKGKGEVWKNTAEKMKDECFFEMAKGMTQIRFYHYTHSFSGNFIFPR